MRIGIGFDIHRLVEGKSLTLGGVKIPSTKGLLGHSDGDVLLHALCDALLGAVGAGDIGAYFPPAVPAVRPAERASPARHARLRCRVFGHIYQQCADETFNLWTACARCGQISQR